MNIKKSVILASTGLIMSVAFINCNHSPGVGFSLTSGKSSNQQSNNQTGQGVDNGRPYDGKVFVSFGEVCPDGTKVRSRIFLKNTSNADLVRRDCNEIVPLALGPNEFQLNLTNPQELHFENQIFLNSLVGTKIDMTLVSPEIGNSYALEYDFGTAADNSNFNFQSLLHVYEDGKPLGPAHALHIDIRNTGLGLFSHWYGDVGVKTSVLRFSSSDNSNPMTNGRIYTWDVR